MFWKPVISRYYSLLIWLSALCASDGQVVARYEFNSFNGGGSLVVPDGHPSGISDTRTLDSNLLSVNAVVITLEIAGQFNGDLYAYVRHGNALSVLLNRPGRSEDNLFGYDDHGFNVSFSDTAPNQDIHIYQSQLTQSLPLGTPLAGLWQPDARMVNPAEVSYQTDRTAFLSAFDGASAAGDWTLFLADWSAGGANELKSWSLEFTAVPEPSSSGALAGIGLVVWTLWRLRNRASFLPSEFRKR